MSWREFIRMGGYGVYVWSAYGTAAAVLIGNLVTPILRRREVIRKLKRWYRHGDRP